MRTVIYKLSAGLLAQLVYSQSIPLRNALARRLVTSWGIGRVSRIVKEKIYASTLARPALRRAIVVEETRIHAGSDSHAGARHRREHGDLQCGECSVVASAALS